MKKALFFATLVFFFISCNRRNPDENIGRIHAESDEFYQLIPENASIEKIGVNFEFTEGPVWHRNGFLLFSDIPANRIVSLKGRKYETFREPSNNANGLVSMRDGSLLICEHGTRSITRYYMDGTTETLANSYKGARLNSPNDLCLSSSGIIYFTDPPWGLPERNNDPAKEIPFNGVFMIKEGNVELVDSTLSWPNGIVLSPDENYLYVADYEDGNGKDKSDEVFWMKYELNDQGRAVKRARFFTAPDSDLPGGPDGMTIDRKGNIYATGPGGILVIDSSGKYLGRVELPVTPSNLTFGENNKAIYVTARSSIIRIGLK